MALIFGNSGGGLCGCWCRSGGRWRTGSLGGGTNDFIRSGTSLERGFFTLGVEVTAPFTAEVRDTLALWFILT